MKYYKTCKECGANLDPDEKCDCMNQKCKKCGDLLIWGKFAYNQEICWSCYQDKMNSLIKKFIFDGDEEAAIFLKGALEILAEIYYNYELVLPDSDNITDLYSIRFKPH